MVTDAEIEAVAVALADGDPQLTTGLLIAFGALMESLTGEQLRFLQENAPKGEELRRLRVEGKVNNYLYSYSDVLRATLELMPS